MINAKRAKRLGAIVSSVQNGSIADELGILPGDEIASINNEVPNDIFEYSFLVQNEELSICVKRGGEKEVVEIEKDYEDDLGLSFESAVFDRVKPCANKCIFCFVDGQPEGLRDSLYVKDDDWRLSYFQGTYVTLTNLTAADWAQIEALRPTPLYISIHTTNPELREKMLQNKRAGRILEDLERLCGLGIEIHAQVVLCPGYNDGAEFERTLNDLVPLVRKKCLKSLAVVPVGISKHHKNQLARVDKVVAEATIRQIENFNAALGKNIAMASDEFFLVADADIPSRRYYGKFHQIEDGVGALRLYLDDFEKRKKKLKAALKRPTKLSLIVNSGAIDLFSRVAAEIKVEGLELEIIEVKNKFFGEHINVAGLICGGDILRTLRGREVTNLVIPSVMLREGTEEFLDGVTLNDIKAAKIHVVRDCYSTKELVKLINSL